MTLPKKIPTPANLTELANKLAGMFKEPGQLYEQAKAKALARVGHEDMMETHKEAESEQGYERAAEVLVEAAVMAFELAAKEMGVTGFQASWATAEIYRRLSGLEGPYKILRADDALYPQYDGKVAEFYREPHVRDYLVDKALTTIAERSASGLPMHPNVDARHVLIATDYDRWTPRP